MPAQVATKLAICHGRKSADTTSSCLLCSAPAVELLHPSAANAQATRGVNLLVWRDESEPL
eukprot:4466723-Prorocentrum_lima.AAC.1